MAGALSLYSNVNILILAERFIPLQTQRGRAGGGGGQRQRTLNQGGACEAEPRRGGGQGHGGEMEETYLAFLNNTDACLLGGTLNLAFPALPAVTWRQSL